MYISKTDINFNKFHFSNASQNSTIGDGDTETEIASYKVGMLGASGVGKTALTCQFTTSEYICAYDASLGKHTNLLLHISYCNLYSDKPVH